MEPVGRTKLWSFLSTSSKIEVVTNGGVRTDPGHFVDKYRTLARQVAELQWRNRGHVMLFRGQSGDYLSPKSFTTMRPTIFRPPNGKSTLAKTLVEKRFAALDEADAALSDGFEKLRRTGRRQVARERLLRWSILQHYEVCPTPLLDVSQSLRIAASFASLGNPDEAYLYVVAVPNISGAITAHAESGLQIVRLSSVCPPSAMRPHIQEGFLLGEYPEMIGVAQARHYKHYEMDFGRRIIAKFRFNPSTFWSSDKDFPVVPRAALYPNTTDWLESLTTEIKNKAGLILA
ncbi:MAG: FRG domain-containing protein [Aliidongia sp.]